MSTHITVRQLQNEVSVTLVVYTLRKRQVTEILEERWVKGWWSFFTGWRVIRREALYWKRSTRGDGWNREWCHDCITGAAGSHREDGNNCFTLITERQNSVPFSPPHGDLDYTKLRWGHYNSKWCPMWISFPNSNDRRRHCVNHWLSCLEFMFNNPSSPNVRFQRKY